MIRFFFTSLLSLLIGAGDICAQTNISGEMYDLAKMKEASVTAGSVVTTAVVIIETT